MKIRIQAIDRHRNGVGGAPFHVVLFYDDNEGPMLAIVFDEKFHCAVLHRDKLAAGDIAFASNSWRGDRYEPRLRDAILAFESGQILSKRGPKTNAPTVESKAPQERMTIDEDQ
jgi:hypothetical protein